MVKRLAVSAMAALAFMGLAAPAAAQRTQLTIGVSQFPPNFHPSIEPTVAKSYALNIARRPFTAYDHDWKVACFSCTEVPSLENGRAKVVTRADGSRGMEVRFTLRDDMLWGDGVPMTSKDIAFTHEVGRNPAMGFNNPELFDNIERIEIVDDKTVVMHLKRVRYDFDHLWDFQIIPEHIEGPVYRALASPSEYGRQTAFNRAPTTAGLYNGPYLVSEFQAGQYIVYTRNPHWKGMRPQFDRVILRTIENTAVLQQNLLSGDIDFVSGELGLTLDQGLEMAKRNADRFNFVFEPGLIYEHIDLNMDNPILKDRRVRYALLHAINRDQLSERLFEGRQPVAHSWVNPRDRGFHQGIKRFANDPALARRLLDEAGWRPGPGGVRVKDGQRLTLEFATTAGNRIRELVQQALQSQWRDVGVDVVIKNEPARTFFGQTMRQRTYSGLAMYAWSSSPESPPVVTLRSDNIPTQANGFSGSNYPGFSNARMDELINLTLQELDGEKRKGYWAEMQNIYAEELPVLPLYFRADVFVIPKWLTGVRPTGHFMSTTLFIEQWRAN